ncbi:5-oxoprolinase subunit C family protein [Leeuwenhoekiella aequorea]|uniref:Biotin-dependent carboxylase-like uncharacterized protein n=1 Tax=Leeuwenhoekiella aequorea TaxID=283736 RepID=A0A4Q0PAM0_9FLAO|nr:biotin-dependent carboxyltransferase family protein [Leeuwenhoekiella aequorea]RXG23336.1 biotin-dependent carboxylase-like uncharacterized protein [Leeuwenhoekiella aequorea]
MSNIHIIQPGFFSTIQDLGRNQFTHFGVPVSGAMDSFSATQANLLLNNDRNDAVLEITMTGPILQFESETQICICGAEFEMLLDDKAIVNGKAYVVSRNSKLVFKSIKKGFRAYLAVQNGFKIPVVLGSRSQYQGITEQTRLQKGDVLNIETVSTTSGNAGARIKIENEQLWETEIPVFKGPEFVKLSLEQQNLILNTKFSLMPEGNRMAIPLREPFSNELQGIITGPVLPGTVQLTPSGSLIVLMRDCQVTGGYPRILQILEKGLCKIAQKKPGEFITFKMVEYDPH